MDISNGPGIRVSLFTQGCDIHCKGCFNYKLWNFKNGKEFTDKTINKIIELCNSEHIKGLSILGGEPLSMVNLKDLEKLIITFKTTYPTKDIWLWTGYIYENLNDTQKHLVSLVDVLVDGPFIKELADPTLQFRGSKNQRILIKAGH